MQPTYLTKVDTVLRVNCVQKWLIWFYVALLNVRIFIVNYNINIYQATLCTFRLSVAIWLLLMCGINNINCIRRVSYLFCILSHMKVFYIRPF